MLLLLLCDVRDRDLLLLQFFFFFFFFFFLAFRRWWCSEVQHEVWWMKRGGEIGCCVEMVWCWFHCMHIFCCQCIVLFVVWCAHNPSSIYLSIPLQDKCTVKNDVLSVVLVWLSFVCVMLLVLCFEDRSVSFFHAVMLK